MDILIKKAKIVAPHSKQHDKVRDILISKGKIDKIAASISAPKAKKIESKNLHVSIGWMDIGAHVGEPGYEHRETLQSLSDAAALGGYTDVAVMPNVKPIVQNKSQISYLLHNQPANGVKLHPIGSVSQDIIGEDLTEMMDMDAAGAIAFSDGLHPIEDSGMMKRALQYSKACKSTIINHPQDKSLTEDGQIHEGSVSVSLGMVGVPAIAEHVAVYRDLQLLNYTSSQLLLHCISSGESIQLIQDAQKKGEPVFASVSYLNLLHTDEDMSSFDSNLKVNPPLRSSVDKNALIKAVKNKSAAVIVSNHVPLEEEEKKLEFSYAAAGATGLETCFAALNTNSNKSLTLESIIAGLTSGPREALGLDLPEIKSGAEACLTLFDPDMEWEYSTNNKKSISANNPYLNKPLKGKAIAIIHGKSSTIHTN